MGIYKQKKGEKGSLKWIQILINNRPDIIGSRMRSKFEIPIDVDIQWISPLKEDDYAEYRDEAFLTALGLMHKPMKVKLSDFWPKGGPQWDALGKLSDGSVLLVEAKAHISEVISHIQAISPISIKFIEESLERTKRKLGVKTKNLWTTPFYQYANRIAHLHFLKNLNGIKSYLVFVNFIGDEEMDGPKTELEWLGESKIWGQVLNYSVPSEGQSILTGESPVMVEARAM
jgi:hypothetical protein